MIEARRKKAWILIVQYTRFSGHLMQREGEQGLE